MEKSLKKAAPFLCVERPRGSDAEGDGDSWKLRGSTQLGARRGGGGVEGTLPGASPCSQQPARGLSPMFPRDHSLRGPSPSYR